MAADYLTWFFEHEAMTGRCRRESLAGVRNRRGGPGTGGELLEQNVGGLAGNQPQ